MTFAEHLRDARQLLEAAGIPADEAVVDADLLARHACGGWSRARLLATLRDEAPRDFEHRFATLLGRRARREPAAYITGVREFWGLEFEVTPATLVPRPETESLVQAALARLPADSRAAVADVCTGTGCIAVALAASRPRAQVLAIDRSTDALAVARRNVARHGVTATVTLREGDLLADMPGPFDLIVSNPPYVPAQDVDAAQPEVRDYEPRLALDGGADGLDLIRRLVTEAHSRLAPAGYLLFEFGAGQSGTIRAILGDTDGLVIEQILPDLASIPRVAIARSTRP